LFFFTAPRSVGDGAAGACASSSSSRPCRGDALRVPRSLLRDRAGLLSSFSPARRRSFSCFLALVNDKLFTRSIYTVLEYVPFARKGCVVVSLRLLLRVRFTAAHRVIVSPVYVSSATSTSRARPGSSSVDDTGWAGRGADDEPTSEGGGATKTLFVGKSRHTLLFLQPAHQKSRSFPLSLLQDCFFGLPPGRGTPKREVAAACAASWATKAESSITSHCLLIQNDLRCLRRRRLCGKVHAPRRRRTYLRR
jgi:hypothetical protein